jgi:hypothetical protein
MIETGDSPRFANEALQPLRIGGKVGRQEFDRDGAIEFARILRKIDLAHSTRTNVRTDFVPTEFYTFTEWHYAIRRLRF